jgi:phenylalanyl-tRNA synthetase beta subunit
VRIGEKVLGKFEEIDARILKENKIKKPIVVAEIDLEVLLKLGEKDG